MRIKLTPQLVAEAQQFALRSACRDCFHWDARRGECWHGWPDDGQRRWPLAEGDTQADAELPDEAAFCKEFELK